MKLYLSMLALLFTMALAGCSTMDRVLDRQTQPSVENVTPRDVTADRLATAYTTVSQVSILVRTALDAKRISSAQAAKARDLLKIAKVALDKSTELWISGKKPDAATALEAANAAIAEARKNAGDTTKGGK